MLSYYRGNAFGARHMRAARLPGGPLRLAGGGGRQASLAWLTVLASGTASALSPPPESAVSYRQMNQLGLRNNRLKLKTEGELRSFSKNL